MMDLFSSFNPISSSYLSMNWMMTLIPLMITLPPLWTLTSKSLLMNKMMMNSIIPQFKSSMSKINMPNMIITMTIMTNIMIYNLTSLLPNTFSITSHIAINLSMALTLWWALMKKKSHNLKKILSNLTPPNTPLMLIPFMVMIELVSLLIQPITLSIRLTANITAGHIMMILISQMYTISMMPTLMMNMMMMLLELGVSFIQAYVFSMLIIMYCK